MSQMSKNFKFLLLISLLSILVFDNPSYAIFKKKTGSENTKQAEKLKEVKSGKKENKFNEKILVAEIYASWCPGCKNIQPTLDQLLKEVSGIEYIQLDVSTPSKAKSSEKLARELDILGFYESNKSKTATVAVIIPFKRDIVSIFQNNNNVDDYKTAIQSAKTKQKSLEPESQG